MYNNRKRHKLLKLLSEQYLGVDSEQDGYDTIGVSFKDLTNGLNCSEKRIRIIAFNLIDIGEIAHCNDGKIIGLRALDKGVSAFSDKKYIKENRLRLKNIMLNSLKVIGVILTALTIYFTFIYSATPTEIK